MVLKNVFLIGFLFFVIAIAGCLEIATNAPKVQIEPIRIDDWTPPIIPNDIDRAFADYQWRQDLVAEQTTRLDMYYASKSGTRLDREEFNAWLVDLKKATVEFIKRNKDAIYSGDNYANLIKANINNLDYNQAILEIDRVNKNKAIYTNDIKTAIDNFNQNVEIYNKPGW